MNRGRLDDILTAAVTAAERAAELIVTGLAADRTALGTARKGAVDLVTDVDLAAERAIIEHLTERFPAYGVLAEESGVAERASDAMWVIDPLDGTTNFAHGHPHCAVSVALLESGVPVVGVVIDPARRECFAAVRGGGARLNGRKLTVSRQDVLEGSLLATGFPYDRRERSGAYVPIFEVFMRTARGVRRMGAAALDLAWVACGRLDGFWEPGLNPWDVAAGVLLVEEAGGRVSDYEGVDLDVFRPGRIVASNGQIHGEMVELLGRNRTVWTS